MDGRLFIVEWPYHGPDAIFLPVVKNHIMKPCRIVGIAKPGTPQQCYHPAQIKDIEEHYDS